VDRIDQDNLEQRRQDYRSKRRLVQQYRNTLLGSAQARGVLLDILADLNFFDVIEDDEARIRHNAAMRLLGKCGIVGVDMHTLAQSSEEWATELQKELGINDTDE